MRPTPYQARLLEVLNDPCISFRQKERLREDVSRDPVDCMAEAELALELARLRLVSLRQWGDPVGNEQEQRA